MYYWKDSQYATFSFQNVKFQSRNYRTFKNYVLHDIVYATTKLLYNSWYYDDINNDLCLWTSMKIYNFLQLIGNKLQITYMISFKKI